jgi:hypothetical protein
MLCRPAGQSRVAARKELEMVEIGAGKAKGTVVFQANHASIEKPGTAFGAFAFAAGSKDNDVVGFLAICRWDVGRRRTLRVW